MLGVQLDVDGYLKRLQAELDRIDREEVRRLGELIYERWEKGRFVFICGNGGSACTASHFAEDLGKGTLREPDMLADNRKRLRVLSLTDNVGWLTALGNDLGYEQIFVQQLAHYGQAGDLLVAISGSGNSPNVLAAVDWANRHGLATVGMTGFSGGKLRETARACVHVPIDDMGIVEALHGCVIHWVVDDLLARCYSTGRYAAEG